MVNKIISGAVDGVDGRIVVVEVDLSPGLPGTDIVGLPDSAVKESRERVRAALRNSGFRLPPNRVTINLAPASTKKEGASFDLPMAVGILCGIEAIPPERTRNVFVAGELSLDGVIKPVEGILPMVDNAFRNRIRHFIFPYENGREAALIEGAKIAAIKTLKDLADFFKSGAPPVYEGTGLEDERDGAADNVILDFSDVKGQEHAKRALEIAAAGAHNVLMTGPPGSGKTMLAKRVPTILGGMSFEESIEVTKIYSVAGMLKNNESLITRRPFRSPHHTISYSALTGGGKFPKPGEISLAHNGVLFLDEFPEFHKDARESLRQPMEDGSVTISRANAKVSFPSRFMLICAMNPCPCGYYGDGDRCRCSYNEVHNYQDRISGPLLDRIDVHIEVPRVDYDKLRVGGRGEGVQESSGKIKERVAAALEIQKNRYKGYGITANSRLTEPMVEEFCRLNDACAEMIKRAYEVMGMSARAYHKTLKVARTLADLAASPDIEEKHLAEALQYRRVDRRLV
ncbi:MAG: YifB family Mg chelatase-like AAA ATPase [Clostridiales bacterium]|nr:YifB family Mg chelatase-like AAA ATPase [Clostridiales bacterium]